MGTEEEKIKMNEVSINAQRATCFKSLGLEGGMGEFKIEKNIPLPGKKSKYPFKEMEVGDSFYIEQSRASGGFYSIAARQGIKISIRTEENGMRVWRIK